MINDLAKKVHENAKSKGFFEDEKNIGEMLCLIHSEVSEALECDRKDKYSSRFLSVKRDHLQGEDKVNLYELTAGIRDGEFKLFFERTYKDTFEDELADIMIRVMDLAAYKGIDLEAHIKAKMRYNSLRPYKHNKKY